MRRAAMAAALAGALASYPGALHAATTTLAQTSPPSTYHLAHASDVAGVVAGMSPAAVRETLAKQFGAVQTTTENLGLEERGAAVATQNFVTKMTASKDGDQVTVWFATPTTGNGAVEVSRQTSFPDPAASPSMADLRAQLIARYGPPALDGTGTANGEVRLLAWSFKGDKPVPCPASACRADLVEGLSVADLARYQAAVRRGHDLTLVALLLTAIDDPNHASSLVVTLSDTATKARTLDEAVRQMRAALRPAKPERR